MLKRLQSRKLIIGVIGSVGVVVNDALGNPVSQEAIYTAMAMLAAYVLGQGIADHGSQGKKKPTVVAYGEEEGPNWEDTTEVDDDDGERKEILG